MKAALVPMMAGLALGVAACEETTGNNVAGTADYDSLKRATADCAAKGGKLTLKDFGDAQYLQDYVCKGS